MVDSVSSPLDDNKNKNKSKNDDDDDDDDNDNDNDNDDNNNNSHSITVLAPNTFLLIAMTLAKTIVPSCFTPFPPTVFAEVSRTKQNTKPAHAALVQDLSLIHISEPTRPP